MPQKMSATHCFRSMRNVGFGGATVEAGAAGRDFADLSGELVGAHPHNIKVCIGLVRIDHAAVGIPASVHCGQERELHLGSSNETSEKDALNRLKFVESCCGMLRASRTALALLFGPAWNVSWRERGRNGRRQGYEGAMPTSLTIDLAPARASEACSSANAVSGEHGIQVTQFVLACCLSISLCDTRQSTHPRLASKTRKMNMDA